MITVAFADTSNTQHYIELAINTPISVNEVLCLPEIQKICKTHSNLTYGVFGKKVGVDYQLKKGDRLEIYRPLLINPMDLRRVKLKKKQRNT